MLRGVQIRALLTESWVELAAPCSGVDVIHYRRSDPTACPAGCLSGPSASRARSVQGPAGPVADRFALDSPEPRGNPLRFHWPAHRSVTISLSVPRRCSYPRFCQESPFFRRGCGLILCSAHASSSGILSALLPGWRGLPRIAPSRSNLLRKHTRQALLARAS